MDLMYFPILNEKIIWNPQNPPKNHLGSFQFGDVVFWNENLKTSPKWSDDRKSDPKLKTFATGILGLFPKM